jgi:hypothetical protein
LPLKKKKKKSHDMADKALDWNLKHCVPLWNKSGKMRKLCEDYREIFENLSNHGW